ncbi:hypothetical protein IEQ34_026372 [Dendrobium chrysotoxum]|uniref:TAFII55 protein conserved region domain-containing protein n=1 Tax=Dendrobium chrysotoxum TaxID=161865 RepID=A0AAV7FMJ7_DENCH|nr:hypothetical protein IEQ34_026372 [Dendrobium chrysotoxum]
MEEQFILRVPSSIAERIERLLNENPSTSEDGCLDLSFTDDGRTGTFAIGNETFPASLLDLPGVVESYKTYDDTVLIKTADIGQIITVREEVEPSPDGIEYRHGLTPPMRDARRRRFRREPDVNVFKQILSVCILKYNFHHRYVTYLPFSVQPELVQRVEKDLLSIMSGGTVDNILIYVAFHFIFIIAVAI